MIPVQLEFQCIFSKLAQKKEDGTCTEAPGRPSIVVSKLTPKGKILPYWKPILCIIHDNLIGV